MEYISDTEPTGWGLNIDRHIAKAREHDREACRSTYERQKSSYAEKAGWRRELKAVPYPAGR